MSDILKEMGRSFGYPSCCIDEFGETFMQRLCGQIKDDTTEKDAWHKTGFIPCRNHKQALRSGAMRLDEIIKNRTYPLPFPQEDNKLSDRIFGR